MPELDDDFIHRMEDILDLYERPYDPAEPVVAIDERPVLLHGEKHKGSPVAPGRPARRDYEYVRKGTANIFCGIEPLAGRHITKVTASRCGLEFAKYLAQVARRYPEATTIHLVMDNLSTHSKRSLVRQYGEDKANTLWDRFTVHSTPKHASWLNLAELEISILNRQCLGSLRISDIEQLRRHVRAWNRRAERTRVTVDWRFTSKDARDVFRYTRS